MKVFRFQTVVFALLSTLTFGAPQFVFAQTSINAPHDGLGMLGSELQWTPLPSLRATDSPPAVVAGRQRAGIAWVSERGQLAQQWTTPYAQSWNSPPGCSTPEACMSQFQSSGRAITLWDPPSFLPTYVGIRRYVRDHAPKTVTDKRGTSHLFAISELYTNAGQQGIYGVSTQEPAGEFSRNLTLITLPAGLRVLNFDATTLGGRDGFSRELILLTVHFSDQSVRFYGKFSESSSGFTELPLSPEIAQSNHAVLPQIIPFGRGLSKALILTKSTLPTSSWKSNSVKLNARTQRLEHIHSQTLPSFIHPQIAPKAVWMPGNWLLWIYQGSDQRLYGSLGTIINDLGWITAGRRISEDSILSGNFSLFRQQSQVFATSKNTLGEHTLYRFQPDQSRSQAFETVGKVASPSSRSSPSHVFVLDREIYSYERTLLGDFQWINLKRAVFNQTLQDYGIFLTINANAGIPAIASRSFADVANAFWSIPRKWQELYRRQPSDRCHPGGWAVPLTCGQVFLGFDDFFGVSVPENEFRWANLQDALNTLTDDSPETDWPLYWLKAFKGAVILKTGIASTDSIHHEFAHEADFDVINGSLVPEERTRLQETWIRIFQSRTGSLSEDGRRAPGYVSNYAETNSHEDWAETLTHYRFHGRQFRQDLAEDKALGDLRLESKYEFLKQNIYQGQEFGEEGGLKDAGELLPLLSWFTPSTGDFRTHSSAEGVGSVEKGKFLPLMDGSMGHIYTSNATGNLLPLRHFKKSHPTGWEDFVSVSQNASVTLLQSQGFEELTVQGYLARNPGDGRVPLKLYYSSTLNDYALIPEDESLPGFRYEPVLLNAGYAFLRTEGYALSSSLPGFTAPLSIWKKISPQLEIAAFVSPLQTAGTAFYESEIQSTEGYIWSAAAEGRIPLYSYVHRKTQERVVAANEGTQKELTLAGYVREHLEGYIYSEDTNAIGLKPLYLFTAPSPFGPHLTVDKRAVAHPNSIRSAREAGYTEGRIEGYVSEVPWNE